VDVVIAGGTAGTGATVEVGAGAVEGVVVGEGVGVADSLGVGLGVAELVGLGATASVSVGVGLGESAGSSGAVVAVGALTPSSSEACITKTAAPAGMDRIMLPTTAATPTKPSKPVCAFGPRMGVAISLGCL